MLFALEFPPINELLRWKDIFPTFNKIALIAVAATIIGIVLSVAMAFLKFHDILHIHREFRRLHVIRISAKRRIAPGSVDRILASMPQPAQPRQVGVFDSHYVQGVGQRFLIELRIMPGPRHGTNIKDMRDFVRF